MEKTFQHHTPSETGLAKIRCLRTYFSEILNVIQVECPNSRERSVAVTHLETAAMWAIKAIVLNDPDSKPE